MAYLDVGRGTIIDSFHKKYPYQIGEIIIITGIFNDMDIIHFRQIAFSTKH